MTEEEEAIFCELVEAAFIEVVKRTPEPPQAAIYLFATPGSDSNAVQHEAERLAAARSFPTVSLRTELGAQRRTMIGAYWEAVASGLITPLPANQPEFFTFLFTPRGRRFFASLPLPLARPSALLDSLAALQARRPTAVSDSQKELLAEAHRCWTRECYRAAMVVLGVATEDSVAGLLQEMRSYPAKGPKNVDAWKVVGSDDQGAAARLKSGLLILRAIEVGLRKVSTKLRQDRSPLPAWADTWARSLDPLSTFAEAVRIQRNGAAHVATDRFTRSGVGLLLAGVPNLLEHVDELRAFFADVPGALGSVAPPEA